MAPTVATKAIKRIITKGLTGWEAGKLILQDLIDTYYRKDSILSEADIATIRNMSMQGADVRDYNMFMALCRGFHMGHILGEWTCADIGLQICSLDHIFQDAKIRRIVELFESSGPRVVTPKQYEDIVAAQRQKKLEFEYSLGYVIEERFYSIAPCEAREEIDELCLDIESFEDFVSAVPKKYKDFCKQATDEIRRLYISDKLPAAFHKKDAKKAEPLLSKWKKDQLSTQETMKLVDMLYIIGKQLYECEKLPEWKDYADRYHQYMFADEDEHFQYVYAILKDYSGVWIDKDGYYKGPPKPSEFVSRDTELLLGLINDDDKAKKSIKSVGIELNDKLDTAEQNIRMFLSIKAILDAAAEAVGLDILGKVSVLIFPYIRISAFIELYNLRLEQLNEERKPWESAETRLEKVLKMLPAIDTEKLKPSSECLKQLKDNILKDAQGEDWLQTKLLSIE
jgi:hypothetical protein